MRLVCFASAVLAGLVAGCGSVSGPVPAASAAPGVAASSPGLARVTLASEQVRLAELFRGTPVVIAMQSDGGLRVAVPLQFSFDPASAVVKPPLGAVLDRLARSQHNETTRLRLKAGSDAGAADPALARGRAESTRDYLVAHGIAASRITLAGAAKEGVEIVVAEAPAR
jgi:outer membrane protein OmpA-like peptidoglycan-associated protein